MYPATMDHKDEFIVDFKIKEEIKQEPDDEAIETNFRIIKLEHILVPEQIKEEFQEDTITVNYSDEVKFKPTYFDPGLEHNYACMSKTEKRIRKKKNLPCEPQSCTICNAQFVRVNALDRHLLSHGTTPSPYACDICGATFKMKQYLRRHILTVHSVFPKMKAPCKICGKWYDQNYLKLHTSRHNILNEKPSFTCSICGKSFKIRENLSVHVRRHRKKTYPCSVCGKFFSQPTLAVHQRIHTGEKPYLCSICGSRFRGKNTFYIHQTIHWTGRNFPCNICDAKFKNPNGLRGHIRKVHGEKVVKTKSTKTTTPRVTLPPPVIKQENASNENPNFFVTMRTYRNIKGNRKMLLTKNPICL